MEINSQIRLLRLHPGSRGTRIICDLLVCEFSPQLEYEALSYTWGSSSRGEIISVDGRDFRVTNHLAEALSRLRHPHRKRMLWVDAVCINQGSFDEKATQVPRMSDIYQQSRRTLVWLGEAPQDHATRVMAILGFVWMVLKALSLLLVGVISSDLIPQAEAEKHRREHTKKLRTLQRTIERASPGWWQRMWILQEAICSRQLPDFCFGRWQLNWDDFSNTLQELEVTLFFEGLPQGRHRYLTGHPTELHTKVYSFRHRILEIARLHPVYNSQTTELFKLAHLTQRSSATDPRDLIYGLLGMVHERQRQRHKVDYSPQTSAEEVFARATYNQFRLDGDLSVLEYVSASTSHNSLVPTWAIDFGTPTISWVNIQGSRLKTGDRQNQHASEGSLPELSDNARFLTVTGVLEARVEKVYHLGSGQESVLFDSTQNSWADQLITTPDGKQDWKYADHGIRFVWVHTPTSLQVLARDSYFPGRAEREETIDPVLDHVFDNWLRYSAGLLVTGRKDETPGKLPPIRSTHGGYWWNHLRRGHVREENCKGVHPCFYVSSFGPVGLGPPDTKPGDCIVSIIGTPSFSLLRSCGSDVLSADHSYQFKGFTYLSRSIAAGESSDNINSGVVPWKLR